jgi:rubrerythrin
MTDAEKSSSIEEKETTRSTRAVSQPEARKTAPSRTSDDTKKSREKKSGEGPKGDPNCTHCFGTGVIMHGGEMPCPWCTEEGKKFAHLKGSA